MGRSVATFPVHERICAEHKTGGRGMIRVQPESERPPEPFRHISELVAELVQRSAGTATCGNDRPEPPR